MESEVKKAVFLRILQSLFNDNSREIHGNNCVVFYHFLLNTLEAEIHEIPHNDEVDILVCHSVIELLSNFDLMNVSLSFWNSKNIKEHLKEYSALTEEEFEDSIKRFRKIYILIKDDFLLDLS